MILALQPQPTDQLNIIQFLLFLHISFCQFCLKSFALIKYERIWKSEEIINWASFKPNISQPTSRTSLEKDLYKPHKKTFQYSKVLDRSNLFLRAWLTFIFWMILGMQISKTSRKTRNTIYGTRIYSA